jgi:hypothetical protein
MVVLRELVQSHVTTASLQSEISAELSYLLPFDESANFENLLLEIESHGLLDIFIVEINSS